MGLAVPFVDIGNMPGASGGKKQGRDERFTWNTMSSKCWWVSNQKETWAGDLDLRPVSIWFLEAMQPDRVGGNSQLPVHPPSVHTSVYQQRNFLMFSVQEFMYHFP